MFKNRNSKYSIDKPPKSSLAKKAALTLTCAVVVLGGYLSFLLFAPAVSSPSIASRIDLDRSNNDPDDRRDRIQIEKINLEVPFYTGDKDVLKDGAWHRFPEQGDPNSGGNFIIGGHRFQIGVTPSSTKERSPFYNLHQLDQGDKIKVFYQNKWYEYAVEKLYSADPNELSFLEDLSSNNKLVLYSCTLDGSADGKVIIEARLLNDFSGQDPNERGGSVLL